MNLLEFHDEETLKLFNEKTSLQKGNKKKTKNNPKNIIFSGKEILKTMNDYNDMVSLNKTSANEVIVENETAG
jgi:hypothetical protein